MRALILSTYASSRSAVYPIAGQPLLVRQLEWLRQLQYGNVVIAAEGDAVEAISALLEERQDLARDAVLLASSYRLSQDQALARAGLGGQEPVLVIPHGTICAGPCPVANTEPNVTVQARLPPPIGAGRLRAATITIKRPALSERQLTLSDNWGVEITSPADAMVMSGLVLSSTVNLVVPASELRPGVWVGRGARISPYAKIAPPVLVGAGSEIYEGVKLGPIAMVSADCMIEPGSRLECAYIAPGMVIGEGLALENVWVNEQGVLPIDRIAEPARLNDPLLIDSSTPHRRPSFMTRLL